MTTLPTLCIMGKLEWISTIATKTLIFKFNPLQFNIYIES